jgi:hypothetical protein
VVDPGISERGEGRSRRQEVFGGCLEASSGSRTKLLWGFRAEADKFVNVKAVFSLIKK